jgi:hypothetical protein
MHAQRWPPPRPSWIEAVVFFVASGLLISGRPGAAAIVVVVGLSLVLARVAWRGSRDHAIIAAAVQDGFISLAAAAWMLSPHALEGVRERTIAEYLAVQWADDGEVSDQE